MTAAFKPLGRWRTLGRLMIASAHAPSGMPAVPWRQRLWRWLHCSAHLATFRDWYANPANPALREALAERPSLVTCALQPYLNLGWSAEQKLAVINDHYAMLRGRLGFLRQALVQSIELAHVDEDLHLSLARSDWLQHEGELVLELSLGPRRLYSLAFTLGRTNGQRVAYVGALQGLGHADALPLYRQLTQQLHGLRPRDLLLKVFQMLSRELGVAQILLVSDARRICSSPHFKSSAQVRTAYDPAWIEHGALPAEDGFARLSPHRQVRADDAVPARKRALYRRRYALLDRLEQQIRCAVDKAYLAVQDAEQEDQRQAAELGRAPLNRQSSRCARAQTGSSQGAKLSC